MRHLLDIASLNRQQIEALLDRADTYADIATARLAPQVLKSRVVMTLFLENSTRTRLSFEMAAKRLGGEVIGMGAEGSSLKKGESIRDTLTTLAAMRPDALVIRHAENGAAFQAAQIFACPVINAGDGTNEHPTQALLDALTLRRHFGRIEGLTVTIAGDILHSRVAHSNAQLLSKLGAQVRLTGPRELLPQASAAWLPEDATFSEDIDASLAGADAVMALRLQKERFETLLPFDDKTYFQRYGLTRQRLDAAAPKAVVLHPGPMNRGIEIDDDLADDAARSLIAKQVEMGVALRSACLDLLINRQPAMLSPGQATDGVRAA